jgi:CspA family cold shock protein
MSRPAPLSVTVGNETTSLPPRTAGHAPSQEYAEAARLPAAEIVARHDPQRMMQRFRALLVAAETESDEAEAVAKRYADLSDSWSDTDEVTGLPSWPGNQKVVQVAGTIDWFDPAKGYGFITPDDGSSPVLLHVTCVRAGGHQTAYAGARVLVEALRRPKGTQAFRILHMDNSTAIHPSQLPQRATVDVRPESDWERVMVKWFNRVRGFGFLTRGEGTPDIFVHMDTLRQFGFTELRPGQILEVRWGMGSKGCMAAVLRPDAGRAGPSEH